jgi:methylenetetrahydrofolate dehydrogenase (NADP+)/methenyltetrahydrofolate cyclohydrolase
MRIDGKIIATTILDGLKNKVAACKEQGIIPHVAIVLIGNDPASKAYVSQKEKKAMEIGAKASVHLLPESTTQEELLELIRSLNSDEAVHGIIVQRPLPEAIDSETINQATNPLKDIDAFRKDATYPMPLPAAVIYILTSVQQQDLNEKVIVVIGKGETGGGPIIETLREMGIMPHVIDSKTTNPNELLKKADIIISTVGKQGIIRPENLKKGVILIGVGMQKGEDGKLHGDYNEKEVEQIASFYTPIPGGVGPVNVAMLLENLLLATQAQYS